MIDRHVDLFCNPIIGGWRTMLPLAIAILLLGSSALLMSRDLETLPKIPTPDQGRIYPIQEHKAIVYGTMAESALLYGAFIASFAVGAIALSNETRMRLRMIPKQS